MTGRAQDTHSVAGEALHQAEDGAVEDVGNYTAVTELLLLFPRSLHLGWKTRNGPLSLTSPQSHTATQEHGTSIVLMFRPHSRDMVRQVVKGHRGLCCCVWYKGKAAN